MQCCIMLGLNNKVSRINKLHWGIKENLVGAAVGNGKKVNQFLSLLLILVIFSPLTTTVRITAVELQDAGEFCCSDPAGPDLD